MLSLTKGQTGCEQQPSELLWQGVSVLPPREGDSGFPTYPQLRKLPGPLCLFLLDMGVAL